ncbi:MAG: hypothetical protein ACLR13_10335 [Acutalibacteraceae bacterium]
MSKENPQRWRVSGKVLLFHFNFPSLVQQVLQNQSVHSLIVVEGVAFGVIGDAFAQKFKDNWAKTDVEKIYDQIKGCR